MADRATKVEPREIRWHWDEVQVGDLSAFPTEEPQEPERGAGWYDLETKSLQMWDGVQWVCVPMD
jgi:hypothetical protein